MNVTLSFAAIVSFGGVTNDQKEEAKNHGLSIFSWEEFLIMVSCGLQPAYFMHYFESFCRNLWKYRVVEVPSSASFDILLIIVKY